VLVALKGTRNSVEASDRIIHSESDIGMSPGAARHRLYASLGFAGASSHSGRRTFVTRCAKNIIALGGSLRDVQELAGHSSLANRSGTSKATRTPSARSLTCSLCGCRGRRAGRASRPLAAGGEVRDTSRGTMGPITGRVELSPALRSPSKKMRHEALSLWGRMLRLVGV
jgi:hypothetical protein